MVKLSRNVTNLAAIRNSIFLIKETGKHEKHIINFDHTWVNGKKIDEFIQTMIAEGSSNGYSFFQKDLGGDGKIRRHFQPLQSIFVDDYYQSQNSRQKKMKLIRLPFLFYNLIDNSNKKQIADLAFAIMTYQDYDDVYSMKSSGTLRSPKPSDYFSTNQ